MKKLLSLLSTITIASSGIAGIVANSPYEKQETIKNSDVNYFQINNLKKLIRNKKQNNQKTNILEKINIVIKTKSYVRFAGVIFNNKLYIGSFDHNVYEYDPATKQQKIVIKTKGKVWSSGIVFK